MKNRSATTLDFVPAISLIIATVVFSISARSYVDDSLVVRKLLDTNGLTQVAVAAVSNPAGMGPNIRINEIKSYDSNIKVIPANIGHLDQLYSLKLSRNRIAAIPDEIARCTLLTELWLDHNEIEVIPAAIGALRHLNALYIDENPLKSIDSSVAALGIITNLVITGKLSAFPQGLVRCHSLIALTLDDNSIESLPDSIGTLCNLTSLCLRNNRLKSLPDDCFAGLDSLKELDVSGNALTELPNTITLLGNLEYLNCSTNSLTNLPLRIGMLQSLRNLQCANNLLTSIDPIVSLTGLSKLDCSHNRLTFLPDSIGNCAVLKSLSFSDNNLIALPRSITKITGLKPDCPQCSTPPNLWPTNLHAGLNNLCTIDDAIKAWLDTFDSDWMVTQHCTAADPQLKPWHQLPAISATTGDTSTIQFIIPDDDGFGCVVGTSAGRIYTPGSGIPWIEQPPGINGAKKGWRFTALCNTGTAIYAGIKTANNDSNDLYVCSLDQLSSGWTPLGLRTAATAIISREGIVYAGTRDGIYRIAPGSAPVLSKLPASVPDYALKDMFVESFFALENGPLYAFVIFPCQTMECVPRMYHSDDGVAWVAEKRSGLDPVIAGREAFYWGNYSNLVCVRGSRIDTLPSPLSVGGLGGHAALIHDSILVIANAHGVFVLHENRQWMPIGNGVDLKNATALAVGGQGTIYVGDKNHIWVNATFNTPASSSALHSPNSRHTFRESITVTVKGLCIRFPGQAQCSWRAYNLTGQCVGQGRATMDASRSYQIGTKILGAKVGVVKATIEAQGGARHELVKKFCFVR
jgi:leucine-rich repeat protein SHOC2